MSARGSVVIEGVVPGGLAGDAVSLTARRPAELTAQQVPPGEPSTTTRRGWAPRMMAAHCRCGRSPAAAPRLHVVAAT